MPEYIFMLCLIIVIIIVVPKILTKKDYEKKATRGSAVDNHLHWGWVKLHIISHVFSRNSMLTGFDFAEESLWKEMSAVSLLFIKQLFLITSQCQIYLTHFHVTTPELIILQHLCAYYFMFHLGTLDSLPLLWRWRLPKCASLRVREPSNGRCVHMSWHKKLVWDLVILQSVSGLHKPLLLPESKHLLSVYFQICHCSTPEPCWHDRKQTTSYATSGTWFQVCASTLDTP